MFESESLWPARITWCIIAVLSLTLLVAAYFAQHHVEGSEKVAAVLHVLIPGAVLVMEVYMLRRMQLESEEREKTNQELIRVRVEHGRQEYMAQIEEQIKRAEASICFTSATIRTSADPGQRRLLEALKGRKAKSGKLSYTHRGIVARKHEALAGAIQLIVVAGVDVRMSSILLGTRLRFVVRDGHYSILGLPDRLPNLGEDLPTSQCYVIDSRELAGALELRFEEVWENAESPWAYLALFIEDVKKSSDWVCREDVFERIKSEGVSMDDLSANCPAFKALPGSAELDARKPQITTHSV